jgi:SpoVK/Ycf46/Vps4 family AAA+-type ATPase
LAGEGGGGEEARAHQLIERFQEAREMSHSLLVLDDVDQLCAGSGPNGYSSIMIATLRALLRLPSTTSSTAKAGGLSESKQKGRGKTLHIIAATSRSDAACVTLYELFDETIGK